MFNKSLEVIIENQEFIFYYNIKKSEFTYKEKDNKIQESYKNMILQYNRKFYDIIKENNNHKIIDLILTNECNMTCFYCYNKNEIDFLNVEDMLLKINSILQMKKIEKFNLGFIGGGEPTIKYKEIITIIDYYSDMLNCVRIVTNGSLELNITKIINLCKIKNITLYLQISVNYLNMNKFNFNLLDYENVQLMIYPCKNMNSEFNFFLKKLLMKNFNLDKLLLKPLIFNNQIINFDMIKDAINILQANSYNYHIYKQFIPCTNRYNKNYYAIDNKLNVSKCHANFDIKDNLRKLNNICLNCEYMSSCLGGCFLEIQTPIKNRKNCIFYKYYTNLIIHELETILTTRLSGKKIEIKDIIYE